MSSSAHPVPLPLAPGDVVAGKYRVERVLGIGGMGVVMAARHTTLDQSVAIKCLVPRHGADLADATERFQREARAAARIESDHVCRVFDTGTLPNGLPFMVMEYLEGHDLDVELETRGRLAVGDAVDTVLQALEAIASAHEIGIVHRDLKPSNIFLALRPDRSRRVKLLDFGISKTLADTNITQTNGIVGTPAYMSPEQAKNSRKTDLRTDIWSVGAILYELLCGQTPYTGETSGEVLAALLGEEPRPLHELAPHLPAPLCAIVHRCLSRDRERRFQSAGELSRALSPYAATASNTALPHSAAHITVDSSASLLPSSGASSRALSQPDALTLAAPGEGEGMTVSGWSQVRRGAEKDRLRRGLWAAAAVVVAVLLAITLVLVRATQRAAATAPPAAAAPVTTPPASPAASIAVEAVPTAIPAEPTSAGAAIPAEKPTAPVPSSAKTAPSPKPYSPSGAKKPTSKNPLLDTRD